MIPDFRFAELLNLEPKEIPTSNVRMFFCSTNFWHPGTAALGHIKRFSFALLAVVVSGLKCF